MEIRFAAIRRTQGIVLARASEARRVLSVGAMLVQFLRIAFCALLLIIS